MRVDNPRDVAFLALRDIVQGNDIGGEPIVFAPRGIRKKYGIRGSFFQTAKLLKHDTIQVHTFMGISDEEHGFWTYSKDAINNISPGHKNYEKFRRILSR